MRKVALLIVAVLISLMAWPTPTMADGHEPEEGRKLGPETPLPPKPKYPRLDTQLNRMVEQIGQVAPQYLAEGAYLYQGISLAVTVRITQNVSSTAEFLENGGATVANVGVDYIEAYVPVTLLAALGEQPDVLRVGTIIPPEPDVLSEGRTVHGVPPWNTRGFTGSGVKVGIIDSFVGYSVLMGTELPSTVVARCYTSIGVFTSNLVDCETTSDHGTAVAEAIADIARDAILYISNPVSQGDLQAAASWMVSQEVSVINMSRSYAWDGPGDGTSPFSDSPLRTVDQAVSGGALWVNSAGNYAQQNWFAGFTDTNGNGWLEFGGGDETQNVELVAGQTLKARLRWDSSWGGATRDFDLYVYDASVTTVLESSNNIQTGHSGDIPFESFVFTAPNTATYHLAVKHRAGSQPQWLQLWTPGVNLQISTAATSIVNPAESANAGVLAVGAAYWGTPSTIESFSSQGPTVDGRTKPEIVGADGGNSVTKGAVGFFGTSQASPHVAGLAALVLQQFPNFTPVQVADYLKSNADPRGSVPNDTWGFGFAQLPLLVPGAPFNATATAGDEQATVNWSAPADGGSSITQYTVTSQPGSLTAAVGGSTLSAAVSGLTNGTAYTFTVTATNAVGTSTSSAPSNSVTPKGPPSDPTNVTAVAGDGEAIVSWTGSASDGGSPITQYNVTSTPGNLVAVVDGSTLSATVTGLTNGTAYTFNVAASNAIGAGDPSAPSNSVTPKGAPLSPTGVTATAGNAEAIVGWVTPASDGGSPITQYTATSDPGTLNAVAGGSATSTIVTGLTNGKAYTFTVTATNALGTSQPSTSSPSVIPMTAPGAPTGVKAVAGDESATVSWDPPASDGGSPITQYDVTSNPGGLIAAVASSTLSATISGLDNGTTYTFTVTATNALGASAPSAPSNAVSPPNTPPLVQAGEDLSADEGDLLDLQIAIFSDSDPSDTHTATVDWGDGTSDVAAVSEAGGSGTVSASHVYSDNGAFTVTVSVTDSAAGAKTDSFMIDIGNVAPSVNAGPDLTVNGVSGNVFRSASFTDPGTQDTHTASIDWGDGTVTAALVNSVRRVVLGSHTYPSVGEFTVTITVTDKDGDSGSDTLAITVTSAPAAVSIPGVGAWGLIMLAALLGGLMARRLGRGGTMGADRKRAFS